MNSYQKSKEVTQENGTEGYEDYLNQVEDIS